MVDTHDALVHHGDCGSQFLSIRYTERLAETGIKQSVGSVDDSYDNALAESIIGLYKAELIRPCGPWRCLGAVEFATLDLVDWSNNRRTLEPIGNRPRPRSKRLTIAKESTRRWSPDSHKTVSENPGRFRSGRCAMHVA